MTNELSNALTWRGHEVAPSFIGRGLLNFHFQCQRLHASWLAHGTAFLKRTLDIVAGSLLLLLCAPILLLIAILIKLEDRGPVFFSQKRVGQFGREFMMFKIRSMCLDAEQRLKDLQARNQHQDGVTFKIKDDPRITRVGHWLRKFSLDELPQFFNVVIGNMSLVGPRPPVPGEVVKYSLAHRRRLAIKPGITCLWQISGRAEIDFSGQVQLDVDYIENLSFWTDLKILALTVPAVISGKGAY
jgi:exopolysaccharide biosynthesis polyprenyl glycosylphosphotransferase